MDIVLSILKLFKFSDLDYKFCIGSDIINADFEIQNGHFLEKFKKIEISSKLQKYKIT